MNITTELEPHVQKQVDYRIPPLDILHGEVKSMLVQAEEELLMAEQRETRTEHANDSMERAYFEGYCEALANVYSLTYGLAFAIAERDGE